MRPAFTRKLAAAIVLGCLAASASAQYGPPMGYGYPQPYTPAPYGANPYAYQAPYVPYNPYGYLRPQVPTAYYPAQVPVANPAVPSSIPVTSDSSSTTPAPVPNTDIAPPQATRRIYQPLPSGSASTTIVGPAPSSSCCGSSLPESGYYADPQCDGSCARKRGLFHHDDCCNQCEDDWTGFYIGLNGGGSIGINPTTDSASFTSTALGTNGLINSSGQYTSNGWLVGGQIGYNKQFNGLVVGIEADEQWIHQKDVNSAATPPAAIAGFFGSGANGFGYSLTDEHIITEFGTVRLRAGVAICNSLLYFTGGAAWGTVKDNLTYRGSANSDIFGAALQAGPFLPSSSSVSQTRLGWTLGGGVETKLSCHWSVKFEYEFMDLGRVQNRMAIGINPAFGPAFNTGGTATATSNWYIRDNMIRVGLNYKF